MILDMAKYGNHGIEQHERDSLKSTSDVKSYLTDYDVELEDLVEECQGKDEKVQFFENLFGGGWTVDSAWDTVSFVGVGGRGSGVGPRPRGG